MFCIHLPITLLRSPPLPPQPLLFALVMVPSCFGQCVHQNRLGNACHHIDVSRTYDLGSIVLL